MSAVSFSNTPQAKDDAFVFAEDTLLLAGAHVTLDVMANDLGGKAKTLFSIDDGNGGSTRPTDLLIADILTAGLSAWEATAGGDLVRLNNGKVEFDFTHALSGFGAGSVNALAAGDVIHDSFVYAIQLGNGTLSWASVTVTIQGQNDAASITGTSTGSIGEDATTPVTGQLTVVDPDHGQSHSVIATGTTAHGSYSINADGLWSFTVNNASVQSLNSGDVIYDSFVVSSLDGTASQTVKVAINGADEVPPVLHETEYASPGTAQVKVADLNGDGKMDIAFCVPGASEIRILINNGDGSFHAAPATSAPSSETLSVADFNGDGILDIASGNTFANNVGVHLGNGDGSVQAGSVFASGSVISSIATYDFNEDGRQDVVSSSYYDGAVYILLGSGDGTLQPAYSIPVGGVSNYGVAVADFGNGHGDIVSVKINTQEIDVLIGDGHGNFTQGTTLTTGFTPVFVSVANLGDGKQDIVVGNAGGSDLFVFRGNGDGTFQAPQSYAVGATPWNVAVADMNNDGIVDLVAGNASSHSISVLFGNGDETFQAARNITVAGSPFGLAVADFNGDGFMDVSYGDGTGLHVVLNIHDFLT